MKNESTPQVTFRLVLSRAKDTAGQHLPTWGIKYTLPKGFPVDKLEIDGFTWHAGKQGFRELFKGDDTPANKKRADREAIPLQAAITTAVAMAKANPSSTVKITWDYIWTRYAAEFGMEKTDGRGKLKDFYVRWRAIQPFVGPLDAKDHAKLESYLDMLLSEDQPSPRMFQGRNGKPDYEVRTTMTPVSQGRYKVLMRTLANYAYNKRLINGDDMPRFEFPEIESEKGDVWSWDHMRLLWKMAEKWEGRGSYLHRFTWICLSTGARRGRYEHIKWEHVTDENGHSWEACGGPENVARSFFQFDKAYESTRTRGRSNKRAVAQEITHPELLALLVELFHNRHQDADPAYVLGELREANESFKTFVRGVAKLYPEAKIPVLSPHHSRHSLATHLLGQMRWPTSAVAAFLGCTVRVLEKHYAKIITRHADGVSAAITGQLTAPAATPPAPLANAA